jgi:hypothetical protein
MYEATVDGATLQELVTKGYDVTLIEDTRAGSRVGLVLDRGERKALAAEGVDLSLYRNPRGQTARQAFAEQQQGGFQVYRSFDERGGIRDELYQIARQNRDIVKLEVLGESHQGREHIALKLTHNARRVADGSSPAVLYAGTYHAREWISTEVSRRLLLWYIERYKAGDPAITNLLRTTELWFVPVHNPDGYEHTFDVERLWRKNLNDNDGDGQTTNADGVDLNRNHREHWNYDDEGSSTQFSSQTYRGSAPESEPETKAMVRLFDDVDFSFAISYHSFGQLLLYPQGWQVLTPTADDPIYVALTGTDDDPAVDGFNPGVSADLYTTNGEFTDWAHGDRGTLAWTPELSEGCEGCGFVFPDNEALIQHEFERLLDFSVNVARSAGDPDDPVSHAGTDTKGLYMNLSDIDPWKTNWPPSDLAVETSYAGESSQPVEVLAKRAAGAATLHYSINGGGAQTAATTESPDGERFGGNNAYNVYYRFLRGEVSGLKVGDSVEYWFTGGGESTEHVTFDVVEDSDDADVLILAAEDRTGASSLGYASTAPDVPNFLSYYQDALSNNRIESDVYDVDAEGRVAPDHLGVLGHYDAVIWYVGNDVILREPGWPAGNVSRLAVDETLEVRQYLNEGGKLLYTGQLAGATENGFGGVQVYDPVANQQCTGAGASPEVTARCLRWDDKNDFLQYYLGAYLRNAGAGVDADGNPFPITGVGDPYSGTAWTLNGANSADNQGPFNPSLVSTSSLLDEGTYPQFASDAPAAWDRGLSGAAPFEPHGGSRYLYSNRADISYKRLGRTLDLAGVTAADAPTLSFFTSYDTEFHWDFLMVEAHTLDGNPDDDWTTLPDANGHTGTDTGESCPEGWHTDPEDEIHPFLAHYQTLNADGSCTPTGSTGAWNGSSGRSQGWEEWRIDLSDYAGSQVELFITYVSDWGVQGLGVWVDDITVSHGGGSHGFEDGTTDGWTVAGAAPGSDANPNDWEVTTSVGFEEGAVTSTEDTLYFGFGFEGITRTPQRRNVMRRSMNYLLGP